ncbi:MAG: polysaccharide biosynthesis/export family protein [Candidatus Binatia bacterium]
MILAASASLFACTAELARPERRSSQVANQDALAREEAFQREAAEQTAAWQRAMEESQQAAPRQSEPPPRARYALPPGSTDASEPAVEPPANVAAPLPANTSPAAASAAAAPSPGSDQRLRFLAAERARVTPDRSYRIGAGDLLEINVFDLPEMNRRVRVASSGYIQLPLIGGVKVLGQSEADVAKQIAGRRLRAKS